MAKSRLPYYISVGLILYTFISDEKVSDSEDSDESDIIDNMDQNTSMYKQLKGLSPDSTSMKTAPISTKTNAKRQKKGEGHFEFET